MSKNVLSGKLDEVTELLREVAMYDQGDPDWSDVSDWQHSARNLLEINLDYNEEEGWVEVPQPPRASTTEPETDQCTES
jgi:hypothetical protein